MVATPLHVAALVTLCRDGQGRGGLLQPRMVGFLLGWVGYRDNNPHRRVPDQVGPAIPPQPRMVGFLLGWVGYRDKDLGSGLLNEAETVHQEVGIALVEPDVVRLMRSE